LTESNYNAQGDSEQKKSRKISRKARKEYTKPKNWQNKVASFDTRPGNTFYSIMFQKD